MRLFFTWAATIAFLIAWLLLASHFDSKRAMAEADEIEAARNSREFVAAKICAANGGYRWVSDTELQCITKHSKKTGKIISTSQE